MHLCNRASQKRILLLQYARILTGWNTLQNLLIAIIITGQTKGGTRLLLEEIHSPEDLKKLDRIQLDSLAKEIRGEILQTVSHNGGHLASNLGIVELTIALLRVFHPPEDKILLDVGHQCYPYKLLTGRFARFSSLRQWQGISGFPQPDESEYDPFTAGHASTAISAAAGFCRARDLLGQDHQVVALVGDGALTGGMCYEALNDAGSSKERMIVIVNDNGMSISGNTGALSGYLTYLRVSKGWINIKKVISSVLQHVPFVGEKLYSSFGRFKDNLRNFFVHDKYFSALGFHYFGPIDGHNEEALERILRRAKGFSEPVVIHVITQKGHGYQPAEDQPDVFHGIPPFYVESGAVRGGKKGLSFGREASDFLLEKCRQGLPVAAVCAAMTDGTGFSEWKNRMPDRLFDVGIAEEHAVTMAAGMAKGGMRPVAAIYDTFMQRAYDQILEDVCQQKLPVLFLLDRAGFSAADGSTHHGLFGLSYLLPMPGMRVYCPAGVGQLRSAVESALGISGPAAVRYPARVPDWEEKTDSLLQDAEKWTVIRKGTDCALLTAGTILEEGLKAADELDRHGISCRVVSCCRIKPLDTETLEGLAAEGIPFFTLEEHERIGGFGMYLSDWCREHGTSGPAAVFAVNDRFVPHGTRRDLLALCGIDAGTAADRILRTMNEMTGKER